MDDAKRGANATLTIDLESQTIKSPDGGEIKFEIEGFKKHYLLNGIDDIDLTMENKSRITDFEDGQKATKPWLYG